MGWSSWNTYALNISESLICKQADAMAGNGLVAAGYRYVNIDDGYWNGRAADGQLIVNQSLFPHGMKYVADYIHSLGLKAGIYSDAGDNTCGSGNTSSYGLGVGFAGHEGADCRTYFADWGYDFIKVDYCGGTHMGLNEHDQYVKIGTELRSLEQQLGHKIHYNICRWAYPGTWVDSIADSWRITEDINCSWASLKNIIMQNMQMSAYSYKGHFNDMDMLEVGRGLTEEEDKTHFGLWCIFNSPLMIGCDMTAIDAKTMKLLTNKSLIAVNQDTLYQQAYPIRYYNNCYVLVRDVEQAQGLKRVFAVYNPDDADHQVRVAFSQLLLSGNIKLRDLFDERDTAISSTTHITVKVPAHGTRIYEVTGEKRLEQTRYEAENAYIGTYQEIYNNETLETGVYRESDAYSSRWKAGWLGKSDKNDLQFRNVYSQTGGTYSLTIAAFSAEDRTINVDVNGEPAGSVVVNTGGWETRGTTTLEIKLNKGTNVIRLYNATAWRPDIDYIDLKLLSGTGIRSIRDSKAAEGSTYLLNGQKVEGRPNGYHGILIRNGKKVIK